MKWLLVLFYLLFLGRHFAAAAVFDFTSNSLIPDGSVIGVTDTRTISSSLEIGSVSVTLDISGVNQSGFNGDIYAYVLHNETISVLVNRPGKTDANPFGFDDNGLHVKLQDGAANGDLHNYRLLLTLAPGDPLTGTWQPDGRNVDPSLATSASPRNALLSGFSGMDAKGSWTLFVADLAGGGQQRLDGWGLDFTAVPEPAEYAFITASALMGFILVRRKMTRSR